MVQKDLDCVQGRTRPDMCGVAQGLSEPNRALHRVATGIARDALCVWVRKKRLGWAAGGYHSRPLDYDALLDRNSDVGAVDDAAA